MNARDALEVVRKASWENEEDAHCGCEHCEKKREAIAALSALVERAGEPVAWISATRLKQLAESRAKDPSTLTNVGWAEAYATDNIPGMVPLHALTTTPGASHER